MRYFNTIREHRGRREVTQWTVARVVDIHLNRFGRMEKGMVQPTYDEAKRLGEFFGVEPDALFPPIAVPPVAEHARAS
jgi:DNA-binding XRE family transcriptional regulator